ncbi:GNAT family N-acetyltransferase [Lentibacter sp. XHP0401]|uniref:GNAT family N-acetyltransferase n=1 Tax=Lentibacter sp. XHP0401 TaxID=2984334 RepID=UPI0021E8E4A0|nr:GNAT family N-acetyltransferase [Lentibacter sp. XHP0401]MCV2892414.1 GNAT family N-acetyltransferase [Lentibacter sp. XHP0401]
MLEDGYHEVPAGHTASVVTYLEMFARPELRAEAETALSLARITRPDLARYRDLFAKVGGDYLWSSRLELTDEVLRAVLVDPRVHLYVVQNGGSEAGMLELDFRAGDECELAFFGLTADQVGGGAGRWLMNRALTLAWAEDIKRLFVHTCTLDHPKALPFYVRSGFIPYKRCVEVSPDPRETGHLPESSAPQIPRL